jgi:hypothetical protein
MRKKAAFCLYLQWKRRGGLFTGEVHKNVNGKRKTSLKRGIRE